MEVPAGARRMAHFRDCAWRESNRRNSTGATIMRAFRILSLLRHCLSRGNSSPLGNVHHYSDHPSHWLLGSHNFFRHAEGHYVSTIEIDYSGNSSRTSSLRTPILDLRPATIDSIRARYMPGMRGCRVRAIARELSLPRQCSMWWTVMRNGDQANLAPVAASGD